MPEKTMSDLIIERLGTALSANPSRAMVVVMALMVAEEAEESPISSVMDFCETDEHSTSEFRVICGELADALYRSQ